jgi:hypothetical protein
MDHESSGLMNSEKNAAPRRYFVDQVGRRVLIGLTIEETLELERLDDPQAIADPISEVQEPKIVMAGVEGRWSELYAKHEEAWRAWIAQSRNECVRSFSFVSTPAAAHH